MKKILIINNYDSFVYNIFHLLKSQTIREIDVVYNDNVPYLDMNSYSHILLSPGPGLPTESGDLLNVIDLFKESHSILGVCLGHQAIAVQLGAKLEQLPHPLHGHRSELRLLNNDPLINTPKINDSLNSNYFVGLYNSWIIKHDTLPKDLIIGSVNELGHIMSIYHKSLKLYGVQFHPESVNSSFGSIVLNNWLRQ